jgi:hypothetical protein
LAAVQRAEGDLVIAASEQVPAPATADLAKAASLPHARGESAQLGRPAAAAGGRHLRRWWCFFLCFRGRLVVAAVVAVVLVVHVAALVCREIRALAHVHLHDKRVRGDPCRGDVSLEPALRAKKGAERRRHASERRCRDHGRAHEAVRGA